jgi:hypothetical protein
MKKIISKMYMAKAWCFVGALSLIVSSCIEEGENAVDGKGSNFIRIIASEDAGTNLDLVDSIGNPPPTLEMNRASAAFEAFPTTGTFLEIRRDAVSNSYLNEPISVTFAIDNTIVDAYNAYIDSYNAWVDVYNLDLDRDNDEEKFEELDPLGHQDSFITLEEERYSIGSFTVDFAAGEHTKYVPMTLDPSGEGTNLGPMDFTAFYGLGIKVTSSLPSNYKLTSEGDNVLVQVVVKNVFDGKYTLNIEHTGWSAFSIFDMPAGKPQQYPAGIALVTAGPKSVGITNLNTGTNLFPGFSGLTIETIAATQFGASSPLFTFDDNNKIVSVVNALPDDGRGRTFEINPAAPATDNLYDPVSKKIIANFMFKQNGRPNMMVKWVMEYSEPR